MKNIAIILAAGNGKRFKNELPQQFAKIAGKRVFEHTLEIFEENKNIDDIYLVVNPNFYSFAEEIVNNRNFKKIKKILNGGKTRQDSSRIAIESCENEDVKNVIIHDAVRPFISQNIINEVIKKLEKYESVDVAIKSRDTIIEVDEKEFISNIPDRLKLKCGQTPQGFQYKIIRKGHQIAEEKKDYSFTDDCGIIKKYKLGKIFVVNGNEDNIKILTPIDIHIADKFFQIRSMDIRKKELDLKKIKNKNVLIFGHSSGIGEKIYSLCKRHKANVSGYSLSNGVDICDYSKVKKTIEDYVEKNGKIDFLISTAGVLKRSNLVNFTKKEILDQIQVNYIAQVMIVRNAIKYMKKNGSISLFTSSSYTRGRGSYSLYSSTKAAIVNLVQALSEELKNVKINAICPDRTDTPMRWKNFGKEPKNTLVDPEIVAKVTLKTCLSSLSGQVINVRRTTKV